MKSYSRDHLSDHALLSGLATRLSQHRAITAELLADLAEADARRLYVPAGYPSMYAYCVEELHLSEDAAFKRIRAARAARRFPAIFMAIADGRLHLSAVVLLAPYLTEETADQLLAAAAHQNKLGIEQLLAERFPQSDVPSRLEAIGGATGLIADDLSLEPGGPALTSLQLAPGPVEPAPRRLLGAPGRAEAATPQPKIAPIAPERYALQLTVGQSTHDKLRYAQALLSHQVPNGDLSQVLDHALDALITKLERRKFAATERPRNSERRSSRSTRHVAARVRRAVWQRDQGQCTFVSDKGRRCPARKFLEFDHVTPVAQGGNATTANLRLRCRAHNQHAAECAFGTEFMRRKREEARERAVAEAHKSAATQRAKEQAQEVIPWLRALGFRAEEARWRAERCEAIPDASLEERVKLALSYLSPRTACRGRVTSAFAPAGCGP